MCGILGYWDRNRAPLSDAVLLKRANNIVHRGPDGIGIHHDAQRGVAAINMRLAIIDIAGGNQPFYSDDKQIAVVQNGEIFNYIELRAELKTQGVRFDTDSDTEVILRLYEKHGIDFVSRLNGMFAIAIDDARQDAFYLVRDRIGVKPLFIRDDGVRMHFGSEIKALFEEKRQIAGVPRHFDAIDLEAIHHYLSFNYIPAPWTIWKDVKHVMPGTWMKFTRGAHVQTQRWWRLADQREKDMDFGAWSEEFLSILDDATRIRLRADVPWGAFLSGGVDSSTIVALMARHVKEPVKTFCIGFADKRFDESEFAADAAKRFGCAHTLEIAEPNMLNRWPQVLHHLDQPHGDASFMPTLRVSELAAKHVKVVLTGDGGDELFAGYEKYEAFFEKFSADSRRPSDFSSSYFDSISLFSPVAKQALYRPEVANQLAGIDSLSAAKPWFEEAEHFDPINQALYLDMQLLLSGNNLVKPDRMGMAVSIEARTPFLDYRMMEFAFRSRGRTKLSEAGDKKHWYKKAVTPLIGEDLAHRKKQMFTVPIGEWFKTDAYPWLSDLLGHSALIQHLFQTSQVMQMLERHRTGSANHTRELRALAALALWAQA
jgi:asparagine synthase (glutamine-hydrolysing)